MKKIWKWLEDGFQLLLKTTYKEDRLERNLSVITMVGGIITVISTIMTIMNVAQHKDFMALTTAVSAGAGVLIAFSGKVLKKRVPAILAALFVCVILFTYYVISGANDGFAILWTLLVPLAFSYFAGVIYGVVLSAYYEFLFIALFYTPFRMYMEQYYTETFLNRFPILYLCGFLLNAVAMINYHVSTLKQIENEKKLEQAVTEAVQAEKAKGHFLAQMSHEIRTPINAVLGMNEMILREAKNEDILEYSENIQEAGKTLLNLINSILDFSKIEDGKMEIIPTNYDTVGFIHKLVYSVSERAKVKGLELVTDIDENLPSAMIGDDVRLTQIISNLLTNAVKYTEKGYVKLGIHVASLHEDHVLLSISVKDTGIGIRTEDKDKLFETFERLEEQRNRNIEGTGLGMAIVTRLLDMMGSEIHLYSVYGEGSNFFFEIRQGIADARPIGKYGEKPFKTKGNQEGERYLRAKGARVLVVDDNEMNLKVIKNLMKRCEITPVLVDSGFKAIDAIRREKFDVVFLDHMMPKMDGVETLAKLKEEGLLRDQMVVIALTANAVVGAKEMYLAAGFGDYLSKPVEAASLEEKLAQYLPDGVAEWRTPGEDDELIMEFEPGEGVAFGEESVSGDLMAELEKIGVSTETGLNYCGRNEDFYAEILKEYQETQAEKSAKLEDFFEEGNLKEYGILIHSLKSTSKTIGANELFERAKALEEAANREDKDFLDEHHEEFMALYGKMAEKIAGILPMSMS